MHGVQGMLRALHGLAVTLGASTSGTTALNHRAGSASARESNNTLTNEVGEFCRLAAECVRHVQTTVRKVVEVAKEHALPPRNPLPYILGYSASAAFVAGCIYYNRATLFPRLQSAAGWLREASKDFMTVHVVEPVKNIYTELVYRYAFAFRKLSASSVVPSNSPHQPRSMILAVSTLCLAKPRQLRMSSPTRAFSLRRFWHSGRMRLGPLWVVSCINIPCQVACASMCCKRPPRYCVCLFE